MTSLESIVETGCDKSRRDAVKNEKLLELSFTSERFPTKQRTTDERYKDFSKSSKVTFRIARFRFPSVCHSVSVSEKSSFLKSRGEILSVSRFALRDTVRDFSKASAEDHRIVMVISMRAVRRICLAAAGDSSE